VSPNKETVHIVFQWDEFSGKTAARVKKYDRRALATEAVVRHCWWNIRSTTYFVPAIGKAEKCGWR
jgi:hypothetical protein